MIRVLKLVIISFLFLFFVVTAISLLIPSHIRISKAINMRGKKDSIFALIKDTAKWKLWYPAFMPHDSTPKFPAIAAYTQTHNDSEIIMRLQQGTKAPFINGWQIYQHPSTDSLTLQWYMDFNLKWYPWKKFGSLFYENTYGVMMEKGLDNIKNMIRE